MKKLFTFAFVAAFAPCFIEAQVLKYGAEAGETAPDTVNWYGEWVNAGGSIEFGNADAATGSGCVYVNTPEAAGAAQDWERVLKFDGLQIKANTNYRVRVSAKASDSAVLGLALMCGDENCDMPFVLPTENGYYSQKKDVSGFNDYEYTTKSALFRYTTDDYQQEIYPNIKADDKNPLGANRFLRLTVKSISEYYIDDVIVEEAPIAGCYNSLEAIKVDFGFSTNIAQLVKDNGGQLISLDPSCAKIKVNGEEVGVLSVELRKDGNLYIFPEDDFEDDAKITVSFDATGSGIKYSGSQTPGDGVDVPSFTDEASFTDWSIEVSSDVYSEPKLVSSTPADGSFELDEEIDEFTFTFDKDIFVSGSDAPVAYIQGGSIKGGKAALEIKNAGAETAKSVTFVYNGGTLRKGSYTVVVSNVTSAVGYQNYENTTIMFETGKVAVADIEYTDVASVIMDGDNDSQPNSWTSYFNGSSDGVSGVRVFDFTETGLFQKGFYLSQRDAENGTDITYGEKENAKLSLPKGNVQIVVNASAWQTNTGNFLYELTNANGEVVASGSGACNIHQENRGIDVLAYDKVAINVEDCKAGDYVLKLTTNTGGYGNAIIVWGLDVKTYEMGEGETADNQVVINTKFTDVSGDGVPAAGTGWTVYQNNEMLEKGSVAGQRTRFMATSIKNIGTAFYNRDLGGATLSNYLTYGEQIEGDVEEPKLMLDVARYNFSWYICNWKGDSQTYYFQVLDAETKEVVFERNAGEGDVCTVNCNGKTDADLEAPKVEFSWTPEYAGQYIFKWYMTGESMVGSIKVEKMGSLAVYWHTQLNNAIAEAEIELGSSQGEQYAGATRDALENAIKEAKTATYHTGAEYTKAIEDLALYVKNMEARRKSLGDYDTAYANLVSQTMGMEGTKYEALDSYRKAAEYVAKYDGVEGYTIANEELLPLVSDMQTIYTLNTNLMAGNTGVAVLTDQVIKLANAYVKLDEIVNGEESIAIIDDLVIAAQEEAVTDDQELASRLKMLVTSALYKAIDKGYKFEELEFPDEDPSEDNQYVPSSFDLSGFIRNSVFYTTTAKNQPENQAQSDGTCPGWDFNAPNGYAADWGWGGWSNNNQPVAPLNLTNSQAGTRWGQSFEVSQAIAELPVGIYSIGADCCDRSYVGSTNTLDEDATTPSYLYIKQDGKEDLTKPFDVTNIGQYYGMTETLIDDVTVEPVDGGITGKVTFGANVIFWGEAESTQGSDKGGFAAVDNAKLKISAKHPTFDYKAAAAKMDEKIATAVKAVESDASVVTTQYFDLTGKKVANAGKGIYVRIQTMSDGSQRASKVLRK